MSLATLAQNQAAMALNRYGAAATLSRTTGGIYDPATGTTGTTTTASVKVVQGTTNLKSLGFRFGEGLVQAGDFALDIPGKGLPFIPAAGDVLVIPAGVLAGTYAVVDNKPTVVGDLAAMHSLLVRR